MFEWGTKFFLKIFHFIDRLFDWLYGSKYNPFYRSGTLAVTVLAIATITGGYLLFFYRLSAPYESIVSIDSQVILSKWVRTLHRYTSDLAVVIVIFHVFRMISEGKTWGPRVLAWITGVLLSLVMFVVGWTGFVMVWDRQGQALAVAGAKMINTIPLFTGVLTRSVSGATSVGASFFFLNLFLHMSLPLGMIFILWLHTSKLNKPAWLLNKKFLYLLVTVLVVFSVLWPAPFGESADLLDLNEKYPLNLFYSFVILMVRTLSPINSFLLMIGFFILMVMVPFYWRPKKENQPLISLHNQAACTGCSQCSLDCPFGAIEMVARTEGAGSETVAYVDPSACVGCGICSASCTQLAIGPEDKSGRVQMQKIKELKAQYTAGGILYVHCKNSVSGKKSLGEAFLQRQSTSTVPFVSYPIDCTGNFHVASAAFALHYFMEVYIVGCPSHACVNRLGQQLLEDRILHGREPKPPGQINFDKVKVFSGSRADLDEMEKYFLANTRTHKNIWLGRLKSTLATTAILSAVAFFSSYPYEFLIKNSFLRIAIRLPGQVTEVCRDRKPEELAALPQHMRILKDCKRTAVDYELNVIVDNQKIFTEIVSAKGARGDKPLIVEHDLPLEAGSHKVLVQFVPVQMTAAQTTAAQITAAQKTEKIVLQNISDQSVALEEVFTEDFEKGRAVLVSYNSNTKNLFHSKSAVK